jgi:hypothetical protein
MKGFPLERMRKQRAWRYGSGLLSDLSGFLSALVRPAPLTRGVADQRAGDDNEYSDASVFVNRPLHPPNISLDVTAEVLGYLSDPAVSW